VSLALSPLLSASSALAERGCVVAAPAPGGLPPIQGPAPAERAPHTPRFFARRRRPAAPRPPPVLPPPCCRPSITSAAVVRPPVPRRHDPLPCGPPRPTSHRGGHWYTVSRAAPNAEQAATRAGRARASPLDSSAAASSCPVVSGSGSGPGEPGSSPLARKPRQRLAKVRSCVRHGSCDSLPGFPCTRARASGIVLNVAGQVGAAPGAPGIRHPNPRGARYGQLFSVRPARPAVGCPKAGQLPAHSTGPRPKAS